MGKVNTASRHAVIFDIDGTLLHSAEIDDALYRQSVQAVLGHVRLRPTLADYEYVTDSGILAQIFADNGLAVCPERSAAIRSAFVDACRAHIDNHGAFPEIPGAREMLRRLSMSPDHAVAIATGGWRDTARLKLETAGFELRGLPLATADDSHDRTEIMQIALLQLGARFESVRYYGDGPWDRLACKRLGWEFVAVGPTLGGIESYAQVLNAC